MTEAQKAGFKFLPDDAARLAFLDQIQAQQRTMGGYTHWLDAYRAKCTRKGAPLPPLNQAA